MISSHDSRFGSSVRSAAIRSSNNENGDSSTIQAAIGASVAT
jgi:hypothetical protein